MEVKDNRKRDVDQIKKRADSKSAPVNSDRYAYLRVTHKKKTSTGVLPAHKKQVNNTLNNHGDHSYCVIFKKLVITDKK